jgi:hypothetical protein
VIQNDISGMADVVEALEDEIEALNAQDPYQPQIGLLRERLYDAMTNMYESMPRGV